MKIQFDKEDGRRIEVAEPAPAPAHEAASAFQPGFQSTAAQKRVESLVTSALMGTLPRERELMPYEAQRLRPRHIVILMDVAGGMTIPEVAAKRRMTTVRINTILKHPDSIKILAALQAQAADKQSDVGARLQAYANEMLTTQVEIARTTKNEGLKSKIAADLLDRAGYGPRRQIDVNAKVGLAMPASMAAALTGALRESDRIGEVDYQKFTGKNLSAPVYALESGAGESSRPEIGTENPDPVAVSASPAASPETQARRIA